MTKIVPITVIIPTYNRKESVEKTLASFLSGKSVPSQFIIVDQSDPRLEISHTFDANITVIYSYPPSLTKARNAGLAESTNDIVLFSDDDILVDENTVEKLYNQMCKPNVALCAGIAVKDQLQSESILRRVIGTMAGMQKFWKRGGYIVKSTMRGRYSIIPSRSLYPTEWAMGYFFSIKKSLAEKWNMRFDENLIRYAYAEDLDFSMRYCANAQKLNLACVLDTDIYVNHLVSQEWRTPSEIALYFLIANRMYLLKKNMKTKSDIWMRWNNWIYGSSLPKECRRIFRRICFICKANIELIEMGKIQEVLDVNDFSNTK